jgi:hypothetical protein
VTSQDDDYQPLRRPAAGTKPTTEPDQPSTNGASLPGTTGPQPSPPPRSEQPRQTWGQPPREPIQSWGPLPEGGWGIPQPSAVPQPVPAPTPIPIRTAERGGNTVRIGLWGSTQSGKTTMISALPIAAMQGTNSARNWMVSGVGEAATRALTEGVDKLVNQRRFPGFTQSVDPVMWSFQGQDDTSERDGQTRWSLLRPRSPELIDFALELQDVPGEYFKSGIVNPRAVENLAQSSGLLYLFDPIFDSVEDLSSFQFFYAVLQQVTNHVRTEGRMDRGRLPHHVSVLITKFDEPQFFEAAVRAGWVSQEQHGARMPYVPVVQGSAFFDWVCRARQGGTAEMVRDALRAFFHPDRVEYFASSAIGFRLNPHGIFDYSDYVNVETVGGEPCIRSLVRPVNVLEPLVRLERRIRRTARAAR